MDVDPVNRNDYIANRSALGASAGKRRQYLALNDIADLLLSCAPMLEAF